MKVVVDLPEKISHKDTRIASCETDTKGLKQRLEKQWRSYLKRYKPLKVPIRCEYCKYVGEAQWHCHNPESPQCHINVSPKSVCSKWSPNMGLLIFLWDRWWKQRKRDVDE